jgi:hypothetical protein
MTHSITRPYSARQRRASPIARLVLYEKMRHPAMGKQFERDMLAFLKEK